MDTQPSPSAGSSEPAAGDGETGDEIDRFVKDLSERIVDAVEERLEARSGELLPRDLRHEIEESISEILYDWCEQ